MNIQNIKRRPPGDRKTVMMSIRTTPNISKWMKQHDYSPAAIFHEAVLDLGYKPE